MSVLKIRKKASRAKLSVRADAEEELFDAREFSGRNVEVNVIPAESRRNRNLIAVCRFGLPCAVA